MLRTSLPLALIASLALASCGSDDESSSSPAPHNDAGADAEPDTSPPDAHPEAEASIDAAPVTTIAFNEATTFTIETAGADHLAFPDVTRLSDGRILLVYRRGDSHVDASGRIMKHFGSADGLDWSAAEVLYDEPGIDDRDPSVTTLANGEVAVNYFQYLTLSAEGTTVSLHENFVGVSTDDAATFGSFTSVGPCSMVTANPSLVNDLWVDDQGDLIDVNASSSSIIAYGGELLLPSYGGKALNLNNLPAHPKSRLSLFTASDLAGTWAQHEVEPDRATDTWLMEPAILALPDGRLLMQVRTANGASPGSPGNLLQTVSNDGGATWTDYEDLGFIGHAPELLRLENGVLLSAFREINDAYSKEWVSFMTSLDDGATWSERIHILDCGASECGYPGMLELEGDKLLVVFYAPGGASIDATIYDFAAD